MRQAEQKKKTYLTIEHPKRNGSRMEAFTRLLCALTAFELLLHGMLYLLESEFSGWNLGLRPYGRLQLLLIISVVVFEWGIPFCGKYKSVCQVALEIGYPLAFALVAWCRRKSLTDSGKMLFNDYLLYWNRQFKTVYESYPEASVTKEEMLVFLIAAVFFICVMLRYVSSVRMFLLLPDLAALFAGLLVNALPQWRGLASFFVGTVLLFAAPGQKAGEMHPAAQGRGEKPYVPGYRPLCAFAVLAVFSMLFVAVSGYAFSGVAKHIPEKTPQFCAFQRKVEQRVQKRVDQISSLGITFEKNRAHVDNLTPEYSGETVLKIEMQEKPHNNLYLKNFDSGTYRNNTWIEDDQAFEEAAKKQGYDRKYVGKLLQQQVYEMLQAESAVTSAQYQDALASSDIQADVTPIPFKVRYERKHLPDAYFPYFSDLADESDDLWVEGDALVRKKRSVQEVCGKFINANNDMTFDLYSIGRNMQETRQAKAYAWYSGYVLQQYRKEKTSVPSIQRFLKKNREELEDYIYGAGHYKEGNGFFADQMVQNQMNEWKLLYGEQMDEQEQERLAINSCRSEIARCVKELLAENASYNLYLNSLPKGTNTIDYFLETGHEGYCMHFATAGALLLQELGVPARYASGYVVKESDYHDQKGTYVADVPDYNAHAWVEIYMERVGWIPVEMTPGYDESIAKIPTDPGLRESLKEKHNKKTQEQSLAVQQESETGLFKETQSQEETPQQAPEISAPKENTAKDKGSFDRKTVVLIAGAIICFLAAAGCLLWQRRVYQMRLLTELQEKKNRQAVKRINRRIYKSLRQKAFGIKTDVQYLHKLQEVYPYIGKDIWVRYLEIVQKAVFSIERMTTQEAHFCYEVYRASRRKNHGNKKIAP